MTTTWVLGDSAGPLTLTLGAPSQPLAGATAVAFARNEATGQATQLAVSITDLTAGTCVIGGSQRALLAAGRYALRVRVTYADTTVDVFPSVGPDPVLEVRESWWALS